VNLDPAPGGICVVRVWWNGESLLIRVTSIADVSRGSSDAGATTASVDDAVELVRTFLHRFSAGGPECR
jgi:hypothetical protein